MTIHRIGYEEINMFCFGVSVGGSSDFGTDVNGPLEVNAWYVKRVLFLSSGFRLVNTKCMVLVDMWKKIQHSNIITLREVFTTKAFGEHCKFLILICWPVISKSMRQMPT